MLAARSSSSSISAAPPRCWRVSPRGPPRSSGCLLTNRFGHSSRQCHCAGTPSTCQDIDQRQILERITHADDDAEGREREPQIANEFLDAHELLPGSEEHVRIVLAAGTTNKRDA